MTIGSRATGGRLERFGLLANEQQQKRIIPAQLRSDRRPIGSRLKDARDVERQRSLDVLKEMLPSQYLRLLGDRSDCSSRSAAPRDCRMTHRRQRDSVARSTGEAQCACRPLRGAGSRSKRPESRSTRSSSFACDTPEGELREATVQPEELAARSADAVPTTRTTVSGGGLLPARRVGTHPPRVRPRPALRGCPHRNRGLAAPARGGLRADAPAGDAPLPARRRSRRRQDDHVRPLAQGAPPAGHRRARAGSLSGAADDPVAGRAVPEVRRELRGDDVGADQGRR